MYAIISEFDMESTRAIRDLWQQLCKLCGLKEIYHLPTPHFTWMLADDMDIDRVSALINQIAGMHESLSIQTFGLGIFTGQTPVLYLPIAKTSSVLQLHQKIWEKVQPFSDGMHQYYSPSSWIPHITLALKDLTQEKLSCAMSEIAFRTLELSCTAELLALVAYKNGRRGETINISPFISGQE